MGFMTCKDDDTCDQPATKGDLERIAPFISNGSLFFVGIFCLAFIPFWVTVQSENRKSQIERLERLVVMK